VDPLEAVAVAAALAYVIHRVIQSQLDKLCDPAYLRRQGVIVVAEHILQARCAPIGRYMGCHIWGSVTFMGMVYRFDRILEPRRKERLAAGELYLEPGLVYVTD
jgi:hypothetical protein